MPKERVHKRGEGWADLVVVWDKDPVPAEQKVRICVAPANENPGPTGSFCFHPGNPAEMGLADGDAVGPINIDLDRTQVNYLIRVLRQARNQTYGCDE